MPNSLATDFDELQLKYDKVRKFVRHIAAADLRSLIISGPPGVGKSFMVKQFLDEHADGEHKYLHGKITPLSLYDALYKHRKPKQVLILDDTDSIFKDPQGQNILKAAMDSTPVRSISWESTSALLDRMKLPMNFNFEGGVILITNVGFDGNNRLSIHLRAIKDRSFPMQIGSDDKATRMTMISFMVLRQDMLKDYNFSEAEKAQLLDYLSSNLSRLQSISLRTMVKLATLYKLDSTDWRDMGIASLLVEEE